jgi:hypothetical protein
MSHLRKTLLAATALIGLSVSAQAVQMDYNFSGVFGATPTFSTGNFIPDYPTAIAVTFTTVNINSVTNPGNVGVAAGDPVSFGSAEVAFALGDTIVKQFTTAATTVTETVTVTGYSNDGIFINIFASGMATASGFDPTAVILTLTFTATGTAVAGGYANVAIALPPPLPPPVPEPASMALLGAGLLGLAVLRRRR